MGCLFNFDIEIKFMNNIGLNLFIVAFLSLIIEGYAQTPAQLPTGQQYYNSNSNYNQLYNALQQRQNNYNQNQEYLYSLLDWCLKLTSQVNENEFNNAVNKYYYQLKNLEDSDLSVAGTTLKKIEHAIKEEISKYEVRYKEQNDPVKYWNEGNALYSQELFMSALDKYSKVIQLSPNFAPAYFQRGMCHYYRKSYKDAIQDFSKALIEDATISKDVYNIRGWAYMEIEEYYLALSDFNKQIEIESYNPYAYYNRGSVKSKLNDYLGAINDYKKSIELKPNFSMAYNNIAWAKFLQKKYQEALIDADKAIELDITNSVAWDTRAEIKLSLKNYNGCINDCNKAIELNPKLPNSYLLRGKAKIALLKKTEGCLDLSKAGELGSSEAYEIISKNCNQ